MHSAVFKLVFYLLIYSIYLFIYLFISSIFLYWFLICTLYWLAFVCLAWFFLLFEWIQNLHQQKQLCKQVAINCFFAELSEPVPGETECLYTDWVHEQNSANRTGQEDRLVSIRTSRAVNLPFLDRILH